MKLLVVFAFVGACVALPAQPQPNQENLIQNQAKPVETLPSPPTNDLGLASPPQNIPLPLGPNGPLPLGPKGPLPMGPNGPLPMGPNGPLSMSPNGPLPMLMGPNSQLPLGPNAQLPLGFNAHPPAPVGDLEGPAPAPQDAKREDSDLKTDATFWRSYYYRGYPSWQSSYSYPRARSYSSYYTPYSYYSAPSYYYTSPSYYTAPSYSYWF